LIRCRIDSVSYQIGRGHLDPLSTVGSISLRVVSEVRILRPDTSRTRRRTWSRASRPRWDRPGARCLPFGGSVSPGRTRFCWRPLRSSRGSWTRDCPGSGLHRRGPGPFGVEPVCRVLSEHGLQIAPRTYYTAKVRPPSARARRDAVVLVEVERVHADPAIGRRLGRSPSTPICLAGTRGRSTPSRPRSTTGHGRHSAGRHPPKLSTSSYCPSNKPVLRRSVEPSQYGMVHPRPPLDHPTSTPPTMITRWPPDIRDSHTPRSRSPAGVL